MFKSKQKKVPQQEIHKKSICRYWNRGFCREKEKCCFVQKKDDCKTYMNTGKCEDRRCEGRHCKSCRYFKNESGCYRKDLCQYLHSSRSKELEEVFTCNQCDFKTSKKITLTKHINTKHEEGSYSETISSFIYRLELESFAREYRGHFKRYGFNRGEAFHVEKMVNLHGPGYIVRSVN